MKHLVASTLMLVPLLALAAPTAPAAAKKAPAAAAKAPAKKTVAKAPAKAPVKKTAVATTSVAAAAAAAMLADQPLGEDALAIAELVHTGTIGCELGKHVNIERVADKPGYFKVSGNGFNFQMSPVPTTTGAVRLEDTRAGAVWLQIANKSMLMNQKIGQRLADECMSTAQLQVAEALKKNPLPNLLEGRAGQ